MSERPSTWCRLSGLLLVGLVVSTFAVDARAAEPLRWQFAEDQQLEYQIVKSTELSLDDGTSVYRLIQKLDIAWHVDQLDEQSGAVITQQVRRIRLELDDPLGKVDFDSDKEDEPGSLAALAGPVFSAMLDHPIQFTLTSRGAIEDVAIPEAVSDAIADGALAKQLGAFASPEGIQELLVPRLPQLPEGDVEAGDEWNEPLDSAPRLAQWEQGQVSYRADGEREVDGATLAVIGFQHEVSQGDSEDSSTPLRLQESTGEWLFNRSAGRMESGTWRVEIEAAAEGERTGRLLQEFEMRYAAPSESAVDAPS